jgi:hypothetical protein
MPIPMAADGPMIRCWSHRRRVPRSQSPPGRWAAIGWLPPGQSGQAVRVLGSKGDVGFMHVTRRSLNGSLILTTEDDKLREERHYWGLLDRTTISWVNNCDMPEALMGNFISAIME